MYYGIGIEQVKQFSALEIVYIWSERGWKHGFRRKGCMFQYQLTDESQAARCTLKF